MTSTPHDALFKSAFTDIESARSVLRSLLPASVAARFDWDTLTLDNASFVEDETLDQKHSDLLFRVQSQGRTAFVCLLFEHQSEPDPLMPYRLLQYMTHFWARHLRGGSDVRKLPAVIPIVLHDGASGWTAATELRDILDLDPETFQLLQSFLPNFRFVLDDLVAVDEEALFDRSITVLARAALLLMRNARTRSLEELRGDLERWSDTFREVFHAPNGHDAFWALMRNILLTTDTPAATLRQFAHQLGPGA